MYVAFTKRGQQVLKVVELLLDCHKRALYGSTISAVNRLSPT